MQDKFHAKILTGSPRPSGASNKGEVEKSERFSLTKFETRLRNADCMWKFRLEIYEDLFYRQNE